MIRHALTLEHIAAALYPHCCGAVLAEAWTQEKGACLLRFEHTGTGASTIVSIDTDLEYGGITIRTDVKRARKNSFDLFSHIIGRRCTEISSVKGDRVMLFSFDEYILCCLLYSGGKANVVLTKDDQIIDAMHGKKQLLNTKIELKDGPVVLGKHYEKESEFRSSIIDDCRNTKEYYVLKNGKHTLFSLLPLRGWDVVLSTNDIFEATRVTNSTKRKATKNQALHSLFSKSLNQERIKLERSINAMRSELSSSSRADELRLTGQLLLAYHDPNLTGEQQLKLINWDGVEVEITIDPKKTVVENAQLYFEKARKSEIARTGLHRRLPIAEKRLEEVLVEIERIGHMTEFTEQERMSAERDIKSMQKPQSPYREFDLGDGYTLYVGRNAANNDQLTMRFAKQNDWWFHARGESGSHAVLRGGTGKEKPPKKVIEQAAQIAAWYSGARNATWTPVVYTQRKYVRKPKGANVGAVVLDREDVVMVKPRLGGIEDSRNRGIEDSRTKI